MPTTVFHDTNYWAICCTAKVASSEILSYVRWVEVGAPDACPYVVDTISAAAAACGRSVQQTERVHGSKEQPLGPLRFAVGIGTPGGGVRLPQNETGAWKYFIPIRDPWSRLISGFRDKLFMDVCAGNEACFATTFFDATVQPPSRVCKFTQQCDYFNSSALRHLFTQHSHCSDLQAFGLLPPAHLAAHRASCGHTDAPELYNPLTRFLRALLPPPAGLDGSIDEHFEPQASQCLYPYASHSLATAAERGKFLVGVPSPTAVPIDRGDGLGALSAALGHYGPRSFGGLMSRLGSADGVRREGVGCFPVPGHVLTMVLHKYLMRDYKAIEETFPHVSYAESKSMLMGVRAGHVYSVCVDNKTVT